MLKSALRGNTLKEEKEVFLRIVVFLMFAVLTHGQALAPRPVAPKAGEVKKGGGGKQTPAPKATAEPKAEVDRNGETRHGQYTNSFGQDTWHVMSCIPGRPGAWRSGQTEKVPCQCLAMVQRVQEEARAECDKLAPRTPAWRDCHSNIPACSELADTGSPEVWGEKYQNRCQVYCYRRRCQCCDDKQAELRMDRTARLTVAGMVALKPGLRLLPREQACNESVALTYAPVRVVDLLYVFARSLVPE